MISLFFTKRTPLCALFFLSSFLLNAQIIYVKQGGTGNGTSWTNAAGDLKNVLDNAAFGTSIWVAEGTYTPTNCSFCTYNDRILSFNIPDGVKVFGGFAGTENSLDDRVFEDHPTYLSGDIDGDGSNVNNTYSIVFTKNVSNETEVDGFIITGGNADFSAALGNPANSGAAFFNDGALQGNQSHPIIRNCTFTNNQAWGFAGAFYNDAAFGGNASPTLFNCIFENNTAQNAAGAFYNTSIFGGIANPTLEDCHFENNHSTNAQGGALINKASENGECNPTIINCSFIANTAGETGGAVYNYGNQSGVCNAVFSNCLFEDNVAIICGAIYNDGSFTGNCNPVYENCIIRNNHSTNGDAGAIYNSAIENGTASPKFDKCIISGNQSSSSGGAIFNNGIGGVSEPMLTNCRIFDNLSNTFGGAIYNQGKAGNASPKLVNCLIYNNEAVSSAGGMYNLGAENGNSSPIITNCTFFGNKAVIGGAIYNNASAPNGNSSPIITNTIIWGNQADLGHVFRNILGTPTIQYSLVDAEDCEATNSSNGMGSTNCLNEMVYNVHPEFVDTLNGDFHLKAGSPAVDVGHNESINATGIGVDLDNLPRIYEGTVDMGPYEFGSFVNNTPVINAHPQNQTACEGSDVTFEVNASAPVAISYQWQKDGIDILDATESEYTVLNASSNDEGEYKCIVSNQAGDMVSSNVAILDISEKQTVSIEITASTTEICEGQPVLFTAIPENGGTSPIYQWYLNGNPFGASIQSFTSTDLNDGDVLYCVLTSNADCIQNPMSTSNSLEITVLPPPDAALTIEADATQICENEPVTFTALPENGGDAPSYQWYVNGMPQGGNSAIITIENLQSGDEVICQMVSNSDCVANPIANSNMLTITVTNVVNASISMEATALNICEGEEVIFTAQPIHGGSSPAYVWFVNAVLTQNGGATFSANNLADGDIITCQMTSNLSCVAQSTVLSDGVQINVSPNINTAVSIDSDATEICEGEAVNFIATSQNGGTDPQFQWLINGNLTGINAPTFSNNSLNDQDVISCFMNSSAACVVNNPALSNDIIITVHPEIDPLIEITASTDSTICLGDTITFFAFFQNGGDNPLFEWTINGQVVGNNAPDFMTDALNNLDAITCTLSSSEMCLSTNTALSNVIEVSVDSCSVGNKNIFSQFVDFQIYPNPTSGTFWLDIVNLDRDIAFEVVDLRGQVHYEKLIKNRRGSYLKKVDVNWLPPGIYFVRIHSEEHFFATKLIVEN